MKISRSLIGTFMIVLLVSISGAFLMLGLDKGGAVWVKFVLYVMFFLSIAYPAAFYSNKSCTGWIGRLLKRKGS
jgi:hypothetical protein